MRVQRSRSKQFKKHVSDLRPPGGWKLETSNTRQQPVRFSPLLLELTTDTPERRLAVPERRRQQRSPAPRFRRELRTPQPTNDRPLAGRDFVTFLWPGEAPATAHALVPVVQVTENPSSKVPRTGIGGSMPASEVLVGRGTQHISGDGGGHVVLGKKGVLVPGIQNLSTTTPNTKHPLYITRWLLLFRS